MTKSANKTAIAATIKELSMAYVKLERIKRDHPNIPDAEITAYMQSVGIDLEASTNDKYCGAIRALLAKYDDPKDKAHNGCLLNLKALIEEFPTHCVLATIRHHLLTMQIDLEKKCFDARKAVCREVFEAHPLATKIMFVDALEANGMRRMRVIALNKYLAAMHEDRKREQIILRNVNDFMTKQIKEAVALALSGCETAPILERIANADVLGDVDTPAETE